MSKNYSKEQVLEAIKGSHQNMSKISRNLDCDWRTAERYANLWECTKKALADEGEKILDIAEMVIEKSIIEGNTQDAKWLLSKKGKKRGYGDKLEVETSGNQTIVLKWEEPDGYAEPDDNGAKDAPAASGDIPQSGKV